MNDQELSRRGRASRAKGARGEREIANILKEHGYDASRTAQHAGKLGVAADVIGLPGFHIEVKRVETLRVWNAMRQAVRDSGDSGEIPVIFTRANGRPWTAIVRYDDYEKLTDTPDTGNSYFHSVKENRSTGEKVAEMPLPVFMEIYKSWRESCS